MMYVSVCYIYLYRYYPWAGHFFIYIEGGYVQVGYLPHIDEN